MTYNGGYMLKHIYLIFISTFLVGFFAGVFVFFESRNTETDTPVLSGPEKGFEVIGYTYGGCERMGCASYRMQDDGSYSYIAMDRVGEGGRFEDSLSEKRADELMTLLNGSDLRALSESVFTSTCPASYDGLAYRYEIREGDVRYSFDSCKQNIEGTLLFDLLAQYFEIFRTLHGKAI
jgi:hypothetical protein